MRKSAHLLGLASSSPFPAAMSKWAHLLARQAGGVVVVVVGAAVGLPRKAHLLHLELAKQDAEMNQSYF